MIIDHTFEKLVLRESQHGYHAVDVLKQNEIQLLRILTIYSAGF